MATDSPTLSRTFKVVLQYNAISQYLFVNQLLAHHSKVPLRATRLPPRNYETAAGLRHLPQYLWLVG